MTRNIDHGGHLPGGWRPLFAKLIADLEAMDSEVKVVQAKQKFGSMRVYIERGTRAMYDLLSAAERSSLTICEECGAEAWVRKNWRGHWRTLCDDHAGNFVRLTSRPWPAAASDVPPPDDAVLTGQELEEVRKLEELQHDTIEFKNELIKEAGGVLDAEAVQALLELPSVGAVHEAVRQRKLLAVEDNSRLWFPNCQFAEGRVIPGIQAILEAAPATSGWRILQYLYDQEDGLAGDRPIDLVKGSRADRERAVRFARRLEE
jgi:hypothetical protein